MKAIVFDCWKTIFYTDLEPHHFREFAHRIGRSMHDYDYLTAFERHFMLEKHYNFHTPVKELLKEIGVEHSEGEVQELSLLLDKGVHLAKPYFETMSVLDQLGKTHKLGIITNTTYPGFKFLEEKYSLGKIFDVSLKSYETGMLKPDGRVFRLMLEKLGVEPSDALMVGDSMNHDVKAAEKTGMKSLLIDRENKHPEWKSKINDLTQIFGHL